MTEEERLNQSLPLLEVLAAGDDGIPADCLQRAGLRLYEGGHLQTANRLRLNANGAAASENSQLISALFDSIDAGFVRRYRQCYVLTSSGRTTLEAQGVHASDEARAALAELLRETSAA